MTLQRTWGRVRAKPSQYVIKLRGGQIIDHGPGLSTFLWPWQSVAILPTSIQRTSFVADQITVEKVGVAVTGIAVYRIADPLLAFRVLDIDMRSGHVDQLSEIMREMFIGAARRLVANMTVDDCLRRRKEAIATELVREIQPVVSGRGHPDDPTDRGWGVIIDTIEIQDVRIQSEKVFADMQAPFRSQLEMNALISTVERNQRVHEREVSAAREALEVDRALAQRKTEVEEERTLGALAREERLDQAELEHRERSEVAMLQSELASRAREAQRAKVAHDVNMQVANLEAALARAKTAHATALQRQRLEARLATEQLEAEAKVSTVAREVEAERLAGEVRAAVTQLMRDAENRYPVERLRYELLTQALPALSEAVVAGRNHMHPVSDVVAQVLAVARSTGFDLNEILAPGAPQE